MVEDHPHLRASPRCPVCGGTKDIGLVVCWPCYRAHGLRYGSAEIDRRLCEAEAAEGRLFGRGSE